MSRKDMDIKGELKKFIIDRYLSGISKIRLSDSDSFLEKGIIDSIGVMELAVFIQNRFGFRIRPPEIIPENFDTLDNLECFILKKLK